MGFHFLDFIVVAVIGLALFGPKTLQSVARNFGKGVAQGKSMKEKVMSDLSVDDIVKVTDDFPRIPRNSRQAIEMLMQPEEEKKKDETKETAEQSGEKKVGEKS
jgi:Sec-independent protein translocase protein TatA